MNNNNDDDDEDDDEDEDKKGSADDDDESLPCQVWRRRGTIKGAGRRKQVPARNTSSFANSRWPAPAGRPARGDSALIRLMEARARARQRAESTGCAQTFLAASPILFACQRADEIRRDPGEMCAPAQLANTSRADSSHSAAPHWNAVQYGDPYRAPAMWPRASPFERREWP